MRRFATVALLSGVAAVSVASSASAKSGLTMRVGSSTPRIGQSITVLVTTSRPLATDGMRLVVVAPGVSMMDVVGIVTGGASPASPPSIPHDGYGMLLRRVSRTTWRAFVTFSRPGRWQLVVPNWVLDGYAMPIPFVRAVTVTS
jgi:hypothetical protein